MNALHVCKATEDQTWCGVALRQVRELNVEAAKLTSSHPNAAQDIEWKRHELEEAWANLREQVGYLFSNTVSIPSILLNELYDFLPGHCRLLWLAYTKQVGLLSAHCQNKNLHF